MEKLKVYLVKNWKTTILGAIGGGVAILVSSGAIDQGTATTILGVVTLALGVTSKDADKTGIQ